MSTTTKSPKKVALAALLTAEKALPKYAHRFSPKKFTLPQLFTCLVLKQFFKTDYRGICHILNDCHDLAETIGLESIPHFTTLQKAAERILSKYALSKILPATIKAVLKNRKDIALVAIDATGLESGHVSPYFLKRRSNGKKQYRNKQLTKWPKIAVVADTKTHIIIATHLTKGPGFDGGHFKTILQAVPKDLNIKHVLADAGYDSESNHLYAREKLNMMTTIPARNGRGTNNLPKGRYRSAMRQNFDKEKYGQRWQVETVFSMIKRNLGHYLSAKSESTRTSEMILLALTHNLMIILFSFIKELFYRA